MCFPAYSWRKNEIWVLVCPILKLTLTASNVRNTVFHLAICRQVETCCTMILQRCVISLKLSLSGWIDWFYSPGSTENVEQADYATQ